MPSARAVKGNGGPRANQAHGQTTEEAHEHMDWVLTVELGMLVALWGCCWKMDREGKKLMRARNMRMRQRASR